MNFIRKCKCKYEIYKNVKIAMTNIKYESLKINIYMVIG